MNTRRAIPTRFAPRTLATVTALAAIGTGLVGCQRAPAGASAGGTADAMAVSAREYVVDVLAEDYAFQAPDSVPSGWVTFRLDNTGEETHFMILHRLPDGHTYEEYLLEVATPFGEVWEPLGAGEIDKAEAMQRLGELLPAWFWSAKQMGGPGLIAPGGVAQATLNLEPGNYVMECYMKTPEGVFHGEEGMMRPLVVTERSSGAAEPEADIELTLTTAGFAARGDLTPGRHTVAVRFEEHPEAGFGNDVHVARLDGAEAAPLVTWMDWMNAEGLQNPAPVAFVGGTQEMPQGYTAYFTIDLEPGEYAWISESPDTREMVEAFTVTR